MRFAIRYQQHQITTDRPKIMHRKHPVSIADVFVATRRTEEPPFDFIVQNSCPRQTQPRFAVISGIRPLTFFREPLNESERRVNGTLCSTHLATVFLCSRSTSATTATVFVRHVRGWKKPNVSEILAVVTTKHRAVYIFPRA